MKRLAVAGVLAILLAVGSLGPASASSTKFGTATNSNDSSHPWQTNGCTAVPDSVWGVFNFNHPCDHHDGCYGGHWASRLGCDNEFWSDMDATCSNMWSWWHPSRGLCRNVRDTYYAGVRALGYVAYNGWSISGPSGW